ncbi:MAG TPA: ATPase [Myxococcales bacterium]|nr:ATPase [Myxococcales bacterium]
MRREAKGSADLNVLLDRINGRSYKAYRDLEGVWHFSEFTLFVDHTQSDPFASPSKLRVRLDSETTNLPEDALANPTRRMACASWLARAFRKTIHDIRPPRTGTGKGGLISIDAGGAEVLERTAVVFGDGFVEARIELGLPAAGRRILGGEAANLLIDVLPRIVARAWTRRSESDGRDLLHFINCIENQEIVRSSLRERNLIAFVGDGAILPRESGATERPMDRERAYPFQSPEPFRVDIEVPHADAGAPGRIWHGMGIPRGIVLLVGGGYHGKSTLLRAIERGIAPHIPGDGRETVVSDPSLVKVRAEDGRSIRDVDIRGFIDHLPKPQGESDPPSTREFSSADASGSTSQAANIVESIEAGATGLLLDEDTSATNFMVRDAKMQALIHPRDEPITPYLDRIRELYDVFGISTLLVMGSSGDYFAVADAVIEMKAYQAYDVSAKAKEIAGRGESNADVDSRTALTALTAARKRIPDRTSFDARRGRRHPKISSRGCDEMVYGTTEIDLRGIEQLFDASQTRAIGWAILYAATKIMNDRMTISAMLNELDRFFDQEGLDVLGPDHRSGHHPGALARPRRIEIAAVINRMRTLRLIRAS